MNEEQPFLDHLEQIRNIPGRVEYLPNNEVLSEYVERLSEDVELNDREQEEQFLATRWSYATAQLRYHADSLLWDTTISRRLLSDADADDPIRRYSLIINVKCEAPIGTRSTLLVLLAVWIAIPFYYYLLPAVLTYAVLDAMFLLPFDGIEFEWEISHKVRAIIRPPLDPSKILILLCVQLLVFLVACMFLCCCFLSLSVRLIACVGVIYVLVWYRMNLTYESRVLNLGDVDYNIASLDEWRSKFVVRTFDGFERAALVACAPFLRALFFRFLLATVVGVCVWYFYLD